MKTIRMPRKMGEITDRLPAPQYDDHKPIKRTNSMPAGLAEVVGIEPKSQSEKKKPEFIRSGNTNASVDLGQHKSQSALLELPHKVILRSAPEEKESSRSLMQKARELTAQNEHESHKSSQ